MSEIFSPFHVAAMDYLNAGWSPIPLPFAKKNPVPEGFTGVDGKYVTKKDVKRWMKEFKRANIALRLPQHIIGIDVDTYEGKHGEQSLRAIMEYAKSKGLEESFPWTWLSTSRKIEGVGEGVASGIRLYSIPGDLAWPGEIGKGIELIRWDHRYMIVSPSVHPSGNTYNWYYGNDEHGWALQKGVIPFCPENP